MIDESLLSYLPLYDPNHSQAYTNAMNAMDPIDRSAYNLQYHHSIIDDKINDSIKVRVLYDELMQVKDALSSSQRALKAEINSLHDENEKLNNEIASIKQALYFG